MVAVQVRHGDTFYIVGEFWEIVERLKANRSYFRFRARRWRWPGSRGDLEEAMQPYPVLEITFSQAQALQLEYDRAHIAPTQEWVKAHRNMSQTSVEWWASSRLKPDAKSQKLYNTHRERVELALQVVDKLPAELAREEIVALQQTRRTLEKYESRIVKWVGERAKVRRREEVLHRFETEMGFSREHLVEVEMAGNAARQALYEELAGLEWLPHELSELKALARLLVSQAKKERKAVA